MSTEQIPSRAESLAWFKSSYSGNQGGNCVEVAVEWTKSSYSSDQGGNCVEVAACPARSGPGGAPGGPVRGGAVHVRDSKAKDGGALAVSPEAWASFIGFAAERIAVP